MKRFLRWLLRREIAADKWDSYTDGYRSGRHNQVMYIKVKRGDEYLCDDGYFGTHAPVSLKILRPGDIFSLKINSNESGLSHTYTIEVEN